MGYPNYIKPSDIVISKKTKQGYSRQNRLEKTYIPRDIHALEILN
jgi:hypothetical protein